MTQEKIAQLTPLKYAGGKSFLSFKMAQIWKPYQNRQWCDLFCGSLALPLSLKPKQALLNDINPDLISFWLWVKTSGIVTMKFHKDKFYEMREKLNEGEFSSVEERGQVFYYLNRTCYNGLIRYSQKEKHFNVPMGDYKNVNYLTDFSSWRQAIANWEFLNLDFASAIEQADKDAFIYADPPYYGGGFAEYYGKFTWENQVNLAEKLSTHNGPVVASNHNCPEIRLLYSDLGFDIEVITANRKINCQAKNRGNVEELLMTKNI